MANVVCEISVTQVPLAARVSDIAGAGAVVDFWGVVRPIEGGREIEGIDYEAHREMAEHQLKRIAERAAERFELKLVIIHHRIGFIAVGEVSLFLQVASPHRSEGFRASQWIVDELKKKVPIWKRPRFKVESHSMNWANRLTLSRLALTVLFVGLLSSSWHYARTAALVIFLIAGLTDFIDGEIARRYGDITNFGKLMDPLVDKIMVAAAFISLVPLKAVPAWAATTIVARDFLITGLRLMASAKGRILPAESLGKQKTSWQIVTIIFFLALLSIAELHHANGTPTWWLRAWGEAGPVLIWITVALTLYSGLGYAWRNRELLAPDQ
jgi:CDP-diacylglycerol--glycerol-3-phosphate 3-phosphatidyltransferase